MYYLLDENGKPYPYKADNVNRLVAWGRAHEKQHRIGLDMVNGYRISTVFLGTDHSYSDEGPPILFETMIFGGRFDGPDEYQTRCATLVEAKAMHQTAIEIAKAEPKPGGEDDVE